LQLVESLEMVTAEIATLQRLEGVYVPKAFAKCLKSLSKLCVQRCISVYWAYSEKRCLSTAELSQNIIYSVW